MTEVAKYVKFNELPKYVRYNINSDVINSVQGSEDEVKDVFHFSIECAIYLINKYGYNALENNFNWHKWYECVEEYAETKGARFRVIEISDDEECYINTRHGYALSVMNI